MSMGFSRQEYWSRLPCPPPGARENYTSTIPEPLMSDYIWLQCLYWERMQVHILSNCYNWREGKLKVAGFLKLNISHRVLPTLEVENIISRTEQVALWIDIKFWCENTILPPSALFYFLFFFENDCFTLLLILLHFLAPAPSLFVLSQTSHYSCLYLLPVSSSLIFSFIYSTCLSS